MDDEIRNRNRHHLAKALSMGLGVRRYSADCVLVERESAPGKWRTVRKLGRIWHCGCTWHIRNMPLGYNPTGNQKPCKHILSAVWFRMSAQEQSRFLVQFPDMIGAIEAGNAIREKKAQAEQTRRPIPMPATFEEQVSELFGR